ncbi:unnamed protein product [Moneuplotes crassus]|uniref:Uncharacterized protein n=1 Tax=Euplotes crassus TaxID=5936 RepID=A0AAD2D0H7_EUPCR|nr:unnamed protein product [Moneuplotes crassus]
MFYKIPYYLRILTLSTFCPSPAPPSHPSTPKIPSPFLPPSSTPSKSLLPPKLAWPFPASLPSTQNSKVLLHSTGQIICEQNSKGL